MIILTILLSTLIGITILLMINGEEMVVNDLTTGKFCNFTQYGIQLSESKGEGVQKISSILLFSSIILEVLTGTIGCLFIVGRRIFRKRNRFARARRILIIILSIPILLELIGIILWFLYFKHLPSSIQSKFPLYLWTWGIPFHGTLLIIKILSFGEVSRQLFEMDEIEEGEPLINY